MKVEQKVVRVFKKLSYRLEGYKVVVVKGMLILTRCEY